MHLILAKAFLAAGLALAALFGHGSSSVAVAPAPPASAPLDLPILHP